MLIYLDSCCLNRPLDDQAQDRIRLEAEAVLIILSHVARGDWRWVGSDVLIYETKRNPDPDRRSRVRLLMSATTETVPLDPAIVERGAALEAMGFGAYDALHLASAEAARADVLLTTDDRFLRRAVRLGDEIRVRVENPLTWLRREDER
jgi:predicted nucleic acid-binding protein